jgi:phage-related protein
VKWNVVYYQKENGTSPVKEFLQSLPAKMRAKADWEIEILEQYGTALRMPYARAIEGDKYKGMYELRIQQGNDISRVFYFLPIGTDFILLHGFLKKDQKTPNKELETALRYMKDYIKRFIDNENS